MKNFRQNTEIFVKWLFPVILFIFASLLFLPKLGQTPLRSWDEAWYAEIARNILKSNNWFLMKWNGLPFYDHPPFGFWLMAVSFKLFRVNEFSSRLPSAICGIFSIFFVYLIGKQLFNKYIGLGAGLILTTTPWFWLRAREGNLDIILVFTILFSIWLSFKVKENIQLLPILAIPLSFMFLTKTIIGIGIIPVILFIFYESGKKINFKLLITFLIIFLLIFLPWYIINYLKYGIPFIDRNIFVTGLKKSSYKEFLNGNYISGFYLNRNLLNLQNGISLWYKPFLISLVGSLIFLKKKSFQILFLWLVVYFFFFFTSNKTELWHFIIIYPPIALLISAFLFNFFEKIFSLFSKLIKTFHLSRTAGFMSLILPFSIIIFFGARIIKGLYKDIVKNQPVNDEIILSKSIKDSGGTIYIDDDYWPTAIFYSGKNIININFSNNPEMRDVGGIFKNSPRPFSILTKKWILDRDKISPENYEILKQVGDRVLIKSN